MAQTDQTDQTVVPAVTETHSRSFRYPQATRRARLVEQSLCLRQASLHIHVTVEARLDKV